MSQFIQISPDVLAHIKRLREKQAQNAHGLGVLVWEREEELRRLRKQRADGSLQVPEFIARLGALEFEYDEKRTFWFEKLRKTSQEQQDVGEKALKAAGLPEEKVFEIDEATGVVMQEAPAGGFEPVRKAVITL